jgi:WD40 repeat protein
MLSPDGRFLVYSGRTDVTIWDATTGKTITQVNEASSYIRSLALSSDGKRLAVLRPTPAVTDSAMALYDLPAGKLRHVLTRPGQSHYLPVFSPDGTLLITSALNSLCVWDTATGELRREIAGIRGFVTFTADGREMACAGRKTIRCYSVPDFKELRRFDDDHDWAFALTFTADGMRLARAGQQAVTVWDMTTDKPVSLLPGNEAPICALTFSADGKALASGSDGDGVACVWDLTTRKLKHRLAGHYRAAASVAFAADGKTLATGDGSPSYQTGGGETRIRLWDLAEGKLVRKFTAHLNGVTSLDFAPGGKTLASGGLDGRVRLWDVATGNRLAQVRGGDGLHWAQFAPDGQTLLIADGSGDLSLWRADMKEKLHDLMLPQEKGTFLAAASFVGDGTRVFAHEGHGGYKAPNTWHFWDAVTGKPAREVAFAVTGTQPRSISVAPDGRTLAVFTPVGSPGGIELWDLEASTRFARLPLSTPYHASLAFSPDSKTLAYGSDNTTILLWDVTRARAGNPMK